MLREKFSEVSAMDMQLKSRKANEKKVKIIKPKFVYRPPPKLQKVEQVMPFS